ncbi:hypothetical protein C7S20_17185 [Christiangramia fulva]|uniref:Uncharacterized protein n=2 Tax=Christiangramia fulva TaxID=2126553 RepID=A0A2R3Z9A0_9FLAO|nr:hypothetical protein C7S20_17185 [Christiangramia fulva]
MRPVKPEEERIDHSSSENKTKKAKVSFYDNVGGLRESTSFLTTSGVAFFAIFGLHLSSFNAFILGIISAILMVGLIKPTIIMLKILVSLVVLFLLGGKIIQGVCFLVDQAIKYFELWKLLEKKDELIRGFSMVFLPGTSIKYLRKIFSNF